MDGVIVSVYMDNIDPEVVRHQRAVLQKFAPGSFSLRQTRTEHTHAAALDEIMHTTTPDLVLILDIDCVPLREDAIPALALRASQGVLAGCAQRANHIVNDAHLYVGPFCMAMSRKLWQTLGKPSFEPTFRGDVGEEFTYRCQELGQPTHMLWPSSVETPLWDLTDGRRFGLNTVYEDAFLHAFEARNPASQRRFVDRCRQIVNAP